MGCLTAALHQRHCKTARAPSGWRRAGWQAGWAHLCLQETSAWEHPAHPDTHPSCATPACLCLRAAETRNARTPFFLHGGGSQEGSCRRVLF